MKYVISCQKNLIILMFLLFSLASCTDDEFVFVTETSANLVIVTDNDPGSYVMVKILGEVRSQYPNIQITYLQSKLFDIYEGAFLLNTSLQSFPSGTVIAGIIEPGANSKRIVFQNGSKRVFAPDNTLATWILDDYPETDCYFVENASMLGGANPEDLSFEDFYAKAICSLISGTAVSGFGSKCSSPNTFPVQTAVVKGDSILGQILFTDNFGNCTTNIPDHLISQIPVGTLLTLKSDTVQLNIELGVTYASVPVGENVCFINSSNFLDLAVNYGDFSEKYKLSAGSLIKLKN